MLDEKIVELYWDRSEEAIEQTAQKYGNLCYNVAENILRNHSDSDECVNDTYLAAWNAMPEARPSNLMVFLCKITRNCAISRFRYNNAQRRGGGQRHIVFEEIAECVSGNDSIDEIEDGIVFQEVINNFLEKYDENSRSIFVMRYWGLYPIAKIAKKQNMTENNVGVTLFRMRNELKKELKRAGIF